MSHFIEKCECGITITQCRCIGDKEVRVKSPCLHKKKDLTAQAVKHLKKAIRRRIHDSYVGQAVEVSGEISTSPNIFRKGTIMTAQIQVKKIVEDSYMAVTIDEEVKHTEKFTFTIMDSGFIIEE